MSRPNLPDSPDPALFASGASGHSSTAFEGETGAILERALGGAELSLEEGSRLLDSTGGELLPLFAAADTLRARAVGEAATYVVNRNINFTNKCIKRCGFCAFSRDGGSDEGYFLSVEEVVELAVEAWGWGATEVCIQAGLAPELDGLYYPRLLRAVREALPQIHLHAFSPEEVLYGARLARMSTEDYLTALKEAGLDSLPGTAAEILTPSVRKALSPGRIGVDDWLDTIRTAHRLGLPTSATMMYGHLESSRDKAAHLALLRELQKETGGFTEFVPLGFVPGNTPIVRGSRPPELRLGPSGIETLKLYAVARLMLNGWINNIQVSWVKEGDKLAQVGLMAGANDLGGTLINESISRTAGAGHGELRRPSELRRMAREMGRLPVERSTTYRHLREFAEEGNDPSEPLDELAGGEGGRGLPPTGRRP